MRDQRGPAWLEDLSVKAGKQIYCAADFMGKKPLLLEAERTKLYETMPVPTNWHELYANGLISNAELEKKDIFELSSQEKAYGDGHSTSR